jgi:sterol desaturase/sphingolipid hydroxylase (fatty acid hydroxylase superfamily)
VLENLGHIASYLGSLIGHILLKPSSLLSIWGLATSLVLAMGWLTATRKRGLPPTTLIPLLVPGRLVFGSSARADWAMTALGFLVFPSLFAATTIALPTISNAVQTSLSLLSGTPKVVASSPLTARIATTIIAFLAFELAYFIDHYLKHRLPFLWHFHKVHHSAETLSPLTSFRVHPIDSLIYANIGALCTGTAIGLSLWLFGPAGSPFKIDGMNAILLVGAYLLVNLQHTQVWIPFRGWLGKTLLSPAHHQLHHSSDPSHFNSNYGNIIALWDVLFRTIRIPEKRNPRLTFGVAGLDYNPHSATGLLVMPLIDSLKPSQPVQAPALASQKTALLASPGL